MRGMPGLGWPSEVGLLRIAAALALPLVGFVAWAGVRDGSLDVVLASVAVRAWGTALLVTLAAGVAVAARARRGLAATAWGAGAAGVLALFVAVGSAFTGVLELGEGEPPGAWTRLWAGPFARPPAVEVLELPRDGAGEVRLSVFGREVQARPLEEVRAGGVRLRVTRVAPVFAFELRRQDGEPLDGLLVKLHPGEPNEFGFERMPHRIMAPLADSTEVAVPVPDRLRLRVQRGKLLVVDQQVAPGRPLRFEGLSLAFGGGGRWARIEVGGGSRTGYWPAAALALVAGGAAWLASRRTGA